MITLNITVIPTMTSIPLLATCILAASPFFVLVELAPELVAVGIAVRALEYFAAAAELFTSQGAITHCDTRALSVHFPFVALEGVMERT